MVHIDSKTLPADVQDFLTYTEIVKGKSTLTVSEYAMDLRTFFRFMKIYRGLTDKDKAFEEIEISDITTDFIASITLMDAYSYLKYCKDVRKNNAAARSRKVSSLRSFFNYLTSKAGRIQTNPMLELDGPKLKQALPKYLTVEQSLMLLKNVDGTYKERDYCILTLFLNCGLRLSELVNLNLSDIHDDNTIRVTGKGNKERILYLNQACVNSINDYRRVRPVDGVKDKNAFFLSRLKQRISPKTVQHIVYSNLQKAGLDGQGYSTHKLRHTAATLMYQQGNVDVLILKEILGHENLGTTEIYTHLSSQQMKDAANANPLSNIKKTNTKSTEKN